MLKITIDGIKVFAHHGVLPEEKERGQEFLIDVEISLQEGDALADRLESTVDYARVAEDVARMATSTRYDLIETLAAELAGFLAGRDGVQAATVTVKKPHAPLAVEVGCVGVTVSRERGGFLDGEDVIE